jgi:predicted nucleic acid-binding protein
MPADESRQVSENISLGYTVTQRAFVDSNVLLYLVSQDLEKAAKAEAVLYSRCLVSVQVLNEITNVLRRKYQYMWQQVATFLDLIRTRCAIVPLSVEDHDTGRRIAERYGFQFYDSLILASALHAGCGVLYSEDMQHGMKVENRLHIINPFV